MDISQALTVTELTARIKQTLEQGFAHIEVQGEVSRLTKHTSGHQYFTIKDSHASISAVVWRTSITRLKHLPKEGEMFVFSGHLSVYEPRGSYQLIVTRIRPVGAGALAAEFEARKKIFAERGWFAEENKLKLPPLPKHIGIVTSATAAAFEDVKKVFQSRPGWLQLTLSPCVVQGDQAAVSIAKAIARFKTLQHQPDVILLVRGGGSMEDLWCFNDEKVVQAIVQSSIPIISGVGHEIDTTLADFAADCRAATPSNAAEISCPSKQDLQQRIIPSKRLQHHLNTSIQQYTQHIAHKKQSLRHIQQRNMDYHLQQSASLQQQLTESFYTQIHQQQRYIHQQYQRMLPLEPRAQLRQKQKYLHQLQERLYASSIQIIPHQEKQRLAQSQRLHQTYFNRLQQCKYQIQSCIEKLRALDPKDVLNRGYTLTTHRDGSLLTSCQDIHPDDIVHIHFSDGQIKSQVQAVNIHSEHRGNT